MSEPTNQVAVAASAAKGLTGVNPPAAPVKPSLVEAYEFDDIEVVPEEVSAPPAEPEVPSSPPAPTVHKHSRRLLSEALEYGLSQEEIDATPTEELDERVYGMRRQAMSYLREQRKERLEPAPVVEDDIDFGTNEDGSPAEPDINPAITKQIRLIAKENRELKKELLTVKQREEAREQDARNRRIDKAFAAMPEHKHHFGEGPMSQLAQDSPERAKRNAAFQLALADQSQGSFEDKLAKVSKLIFSAPAKQEPPLEQWEIDAAKARAQKQNGQPPITPERWEQAALAKPTSRAQPALKKGIAAAKETFAKGMEELGVEGAGVNHEMTNELPD